MKTREQKRTAVERRNRRRRSPKRLYRSIFFHNARTWGTLLRDYKVLSKPTDPFFAFRGVLVMRP